MEFGETFRRINPVNNKRNLKIFLFYFVVGLLGYSSILTSHYIYNDDFCRYILNYTCGVNNRFANTVLEYLMFLCPRVFDVAPFSQIVSCAVLAFTALVCLRICCKTVDRCSICLFATVIVNPFVVENMLFRFDNQFMLFALLCSVMAAYVSVMDDLRNLLLQTALLFGSLLLYQGALPAYFTIFLYLLLRKVSHGGKFLHCVTFAKLWIYTMGITAVLYAPVAYNLNYVHRNRKAFEGSNLWGYMEFVWKRIGGYFTEIYVNWNHTIVGQISFLFIVGFLIHLLMETWKYKSSGIDFARRCLVISPLFFLFLLSPAGLTILFNHAGNYAAGEFPPRVIYSAPIVIALALEGAQPLFSKIYLLRTFSKVFAGIFLLWNISFTNLTGNLLERQFNIQNDIAKDIAEDLYNIKNHCDYRIAVKYPYPTFWPAFVGAFEEYPVLKIILGYQWHRPIFCNVLLRYNGRWYPRIFGQESISDKAIRLADRMWYALYADGDTLIIELKPSL